MNHRYSTSQLWSLVLLRFFIGWHFLFEGLSKFMNPQWSSLGFLRESKWIMAGFAGWITSSSEVLSVVDFLNTWGLLAIGLGLMLGLFARTASAFGVILLLMYYLNSPPLTGLEYSLPSDGNYLIINKTLIEALSLFVLFLFPTSHLIGLDLFLHRRKQGNNEEK
jgi:thiosulfate dehydrogenase [quinone] large subunit